MTLLVGLFALNFMAADLSGAWTLNYEKDVTGKPAHHECTLQQQGQKLTGTCDGDAKFTGQVQDGKVTLEHKTSGSNDVVHYDAIVNKEGSFMKGTWQFVDPATKKVKSGRFAFSKH